MVPLRPVLLLALLGLLAPVGAAEEADPKEVARLKAEMETRAGVAPAVQRGVAWLRAQQQKDGALQPKLETPKKVKLPKGIKRPPAFQGHNRHRFGKTALAALTLAHCGVTPENATLLSALEYLRKEYRGVMRKGYANHGATYSMGLLLMALHAYYKLEDAPRNEKADPKRNPLGMPGRDLAIVRTVGDWLIRTRIDGGLWGYPYPPVKRSRRARVPQDATGYVPRGDMSNSQYALLGLWTATRCGWTAPREPMVAIAEEVLRWQGSQGPAVRRGLDPAPGGSGASTSVAPLVDRARGFGYGPPMRRGVTLMHTGSMTAGGLSSMLIAMAILREQGELEERLARRLERGCWDAIAWLAQHYDLGKNPRSVEAAPTLDPKIREQMEKNLQQFGSMWHLYYLYGLERALVIAGKRLLGTHDWWLEGAALLLGAQGKDGAWGAPIAKPQGAAGVAGFGYDKFADTCFALLFLQRATLRPKAPLLQVHPKPRKESGEARDDG